MTDQIAIDRLSTTASRACVGLGIQADCYIDFYRSYVKNGVMRLCLWRYKPKNIDE